MSLNVLLIGSGGREHAIAWKLASSPRLKKLYIAPGNAGTAEVGENVAIPATDFMRLADFAEDKKIDLTIVGPDDPLAAGIVDYFETRGLKIWGPTQAAAQLESSKAFSKELMAEAGIPTAEFEVFSDYHKALSYVREKGAPIVVKASGLALGKGVVVAATLQEAEHALKEMMVDKAFGDAGSEVVVEEFLIGPEISVHAMCRGGRYVMFPPAQDHKRALDGDEGKNTGGMGTISPLPWVSEEVMQEIARTVVEPTLRLMSARGTPFNGLLFPGLIMTAKGPRVLEFNARFGDPETQSYMRLLSSDLLDLIDGSEDVEWRNGYAANIVLASGGYPGDYTKGLPITGIEEAGEVEGVVIFHAGTKINDDGELVTNGGRVIGVSAIGKTLEETLARAYEAADRIKFKNKHMRLDIGAKSLK